MKLVSIIIPLYNSECFLNETLNSVLSQTYKNIEVILIDDNSTDGSLNIGLNFQKQHPPKILLYKNKGKGACAARNYGFELSKGEYIQFLDADDMLSPDKIERQVKALEEQPGCIAVCETWHFKNTIQEAINSDKEYLFSTTKPEDFFIQLWGGNELLPNMIQTSAWLTPRGLIERNGLWDTSLEKDQDGEFFARIALNSKGIVYIPEIKNYYRKHTKGKNIAGQKQKIHLESNLRSTSLKEQYLLNSTNSKYANKAMASQYLIVAIDAWPRYKDITKQALTKVKQLGGTSYLPVLGGSLIEGIKRTLGWKIAKGFSYYLHKFI